MYKNVFYCEENGHLFEWFPHETPSLDKMEICHYCKSPLTYLGEIKYNPETDIWESMFWKELVCPHTALGSSYDKNTHVFMYACVPMRWKIHKTKEIVDYHSGNPK